MADKRYITRQEAGTVKGWVVRIDQGKSTEISQSFSDSSYGGKDRALEAARVYRDQRLSERTTPTRYRRYTKKSNKSGYLGVHREQKPFSEHSIYRGWRATYYVDGHNKHGEPCRKQQHESFSSKEYGECEAFRKACRARYNYAGELRQILEHPDAPCEPDVPVKKVYKGR